MSIPFLWLALPVASTLAGGLIALRLDRYRPLLVATGAGLLLGAAFLDLLPEAIALGANAGWQAANVMSVALLSFLIFTAMDMVLERWSNAQASRWTGSRAAGRLAGGLLIFHSFRDGMAIGAAFAASHRAGYAVAVGIAAHDFGDGMNTVILTTQGEKAGITDYVFLALDALAPFIGGLLTIWWLLSSSHTAMLLAAAAGFFLQMATSDFLPQLKQQRGDRGWLMLAVVAGGAAVIYAANQLIR